MESGVTNYRRGLFRLGSKFVGVDLMFWRLNPPDIAGLFNFGRAKFVVIEEHRRGRKEAERLLMSQRIPIKATGWHTGTRQVQGLEQNPTPDQIDYTHGGELPQEWADQSQQIAEENADPSGPGASAKDVDVPVVIFYTKKTQAYYARIALQADDFKLLEIPRASQHPSRKARDGYEFKPVTTKSPKRKKAVRRRRPGRL